MIRPFAALRPARGKEKSIASLPYDVMNTQEAREMAYGNEDSFLHVSRAEIDFSEGIDEHSDAVYQKAKQNLEDMIRRGSLVQDSKAQYYLYELQMHGRSQTGLVACSSIDDYFNDVIKKHEFTRPEKELDRIRHMEALSAHVGPIFLTYQQNPELDSIFEKVKRNPSAFAFIAEDGIAHQGWEISELGDIEAITNLFNQQVRFTYIADGHHRAASSAKVGLKQRNQMGAFKGEEEFNFFLSVLFPDNQLAIMDYNRVVKDLNGHSDAEFISLLAEKFEIQELHIGTSEEARPSLLHDFGMYLNRKWYRLRAKPESYTTDPIGVLDVTILQNHVLSPLLGVQDPRTDKRIDFVGGIRGLDALKQRVDSGQAAVAFALYPVTIEQLIAIADSGQVMPPKSTWFEPKLRDGLFSHLF